MGSIVVDVLAAVVAAASAVVVIALSLASFCSLFVVSYEICVPQTLKQVHSSCTCTLSLPLYPSSLREQASSPPNHSVRSIQTCSYPLISRFVDHIWNFHIRVKEARPISNIPLG